MGQQPNIQLPPEDLPRRVPGPGAARRWRPGRPGELRSPEQVPWGGAFGTPAPDGGFAARLVAARGIRVGPGEDHRDLAAAVRAIAAARASRLGRAPALVDVEVAEMLLGLHPDQEEGTVSPQRRAERLGGVGRDAVALGDLVASVDPALLDLTLDEVGDRVGRGEGPVGR